MNKGKQFEEKFKEDWLKMDGAVVERLYDQVSGNYGTSRNPCDFICYLYPNMFYIECKETEENTFNFSKLTQYEKLLKRSNVFGVRSGVVIWFSKRNKVVYVPITTVKKLKEDGYKSISSGKLDFYEENNYKVLDIPSILKRVFMDSDYSIMHALEEGF